MVNTYEFVLENKTYLLRTFFSIFNLKNTISIHFMWNYFVHQEQYITLFIL